MLDFLSVLTVFFIFTLTTVTITVGETVESTKAEGKPQEEDISVLLQNKENLSLLVRQELKFEELVKEYTENLDQHLTITPKELKKLKYYLSHFINILFQFIEKKQKNYFIMDGMHIWVTDFLTTN